MAERRQIKRYPIQLNARYLEGKGKDWKDCTVTDINNEGIRIIVSPHEKLHLDSTLQLEIVTPLKEKPIKATCTLLWKRETREKTHFKNFEEVTDIVEGGARLEKIDSEDLRDILKIEEIIDGIKCPKNFFCYRSGFNSLCKAESIGVASLVLCLEETPQECNFSYFSDDRSFCKCPLRIYIAKELRK